MKCVVFSRYNRFNLIYPQKIKDQHPSQLVTYPWDLILHSDILMLHSDPKVPNWWGQMFHSMFYFALQRKREVLYEQWENLVIHISKCHIFKPSPSPLFLFPQQNGLIQTVYKGLGSCQWMNIFHRIIILSLIISSVSYGKNTKYLQKISINPWDIIATNLRQQMRAGKVWCLEAVKGAQNSWHGQGIPWALICASNQSTQRHLQFSEIKWPNRCQ